MDTKELINLKKKIENIDISHHIEIFRIFQENNISFSENRNGIFINMNNLTSEIINKIIKYLTYIKTQEQHLNNVEQLKSTYKINYFDKSDKDNKDIPTLYVNES